jgi:lipoprotein-anchoring transpeptidase ErfK/SrfK
MSRININITTQELVYEDNNGNIIRRYPVSTSRHGAGERLGSFCTPRGRHIIRAKIGTGQPVNTIFVGRRPTGEVYSPELAVQFPNRDWILTRILWLSGCDIGFNRLGQVDTMRRYIYIHGSPDSVDMGIPASIGCIRMKNNDIIDLYDRVLPGTRVEIVE